jgi:DNA-binding CsgD family transcriptional regulator
MSETRRELTQADARGALAYAGELAACNSPAELEDRVLTLSALVAADSLIIGDVTRAGARQPPEVVVRGDPPEAFGPSTLAAFAHWAYQHPLVDMHFLGFAPRATRLTDLLSRARWQRLEVYNDCYRQMGPVDWEIAVQIQRSPTTVKCVALQRVRPDFSERDRALLDVLAPHLRAAYARVQASAEVQRRVALLEQGLEERGELPLLVTRTGRIAAAGPRARALLREWFGVADRAASLPDDVAGWWARERKTGAPAVLDVVRGGRRLRLRLVAGAQEDVVLIAEVRDEPLSAAALARRLPVSHREGEVLAGLAQGHTNAAIAHDLGISAHTVARHLERIYARLAVSNRAAATALAHAALRNDP